MKFLLVLSAFVGFASTKIESSIWKTTFTFPEQRNILRIIGGQEASRSQFPYQVGLFLQYQLSETFCGGSLVSTNYVLTAAHCAEGAISIDIVLGALNISDDSEIGKQRMTSTSYIVHPDWDSFSLTNDLALVKLPTPAVINDYVKIVTLASSSDSYAGNLGTISGWGKTTDDQSVVSDILRYTSNTILSNTECKATDSDYNGIIVSTHLCLSGTGKTGICQGDSGGPLITNGIQVGISSFAYRSCEASKPSVFTRVTDFKQWIQTNSDVTF